jgi:hypothetical protein
LKDLQNGHIVLPIQIKAPGLIRSEGRFRKEAMRTRFAFRMPQARIKKGYTP